MVMMIIDRILSGVYTGVQFLAAPCCIFNQCWSGSNTDDDDKVNQKEHIAGISTEASIDNTNLNNVSTIDCNHPSKNKPSKHCSKNRSGRFKKRPHKQALDEKKKNEKMKIMHQFLNREINIRSKQSHQLLI
jgi:hypothetical protein